MFDDGRLKLFLKQRKKFVANSRPRSSRVAVRGVFAPFLVLGAKVGSQLGPANFQQRPNDGTCNRMNSAEPGEPCSAQDMREHGLRLIVSRVGNRDAPERARIHERAEIIVARAAGRVLQICSLLLCYLGYANRSGMKLQALLRGQLGDEFLIRVGSLAAQFVV